MAQDDKIKYIILPTGQSDNKTGQSDNKTGQSDNKTCFSDIALTNIFSNHTALIASERSVIWSRYNAMLLGNSVVLGFIAHRFDIKNIEICLGSIFGLLLCTAWLIITCSGWRLYSIQTREAMRFLWQDLHEEINPTTAAIENWQKVYGDWIKWIAFAVIILFKMIYLAIFIGYWYILSKKC